MKTLKPIGDIKVGEGPDAIIYDSNSGKVVVMNGHGKNVMAIDPDSMKVVGTVDVGSKVEFAAAEPGHVFVNLEDTGEIANIDSSSWKLLGKWSIKPCGEPSGLAIDTESHRLFSVCDKVMAVVDAESGKVVATPTIGEGPDAAGFDPGNKMAFASCGDGTLTAVHEDSADKYSVAQTIQTQKGARTMALDPKTHRVFLVTAEFGEKAAGRTASADEAGDVYAAGVSRRSRCSVLRHVGWASVRPFFGKRKSGSEGIRNRFLGGLRPVVSILGLGWGVATPRSRIAFLANSHRNLIERQMAERVQRTCFALNLSHCYLLGGAYVTTRSRLGHRSGAAAGRRIAALGT